MEELSTDILVIGAGVAGAAVAASLKGSGFRITVVEPRSPGHDSHRGDTLYPASIKILDEWKALPLIMQKGALKFRKIAVMNQERALVEVDMASVSSAFPYGIVLDHALIEDALLEFAQTDKLQLLRGFALQEVLVARDGVHGAVVAGQGTKYLVRSKLIIGADGRNSTVREAMGIKAEYAEYGKDWVASCMPVAEGSFAGICLFIKPGEALLAEPLPPGNRLRVSIQRPGGSAQEWITKSPEEKHEYIASFSPQLAKASPVFEEENIYLLKSKNSPKYWANRAVIVGDAAHEAHPISSHGMLMAIFDAYALSVALGNSLENLEAKLAKYESVSRPVATKIIRHSSAFAKFLTRQPDKKPGQSTNSMKSVKTNLQRHFSVFKRLISEKTYDSELKKRGG